MVSGLRRWVTGLGLSVLAATAPAASAGRVYLSDGSRLVGTIQRMADGELTVETKFAGELTVQAGEVVGISSDRKLTVALATGDRVVGVPSYSEQAGQTLTETAFGKVEIDGGQITALWPPDAQPPRRTAQKKQVKKKIAEVKEQQQQKVAELKDQHQQRVQKIQQQMTELEKRQAKLEEPWSARVEFGLNGETGNNERLAIRGRGEARRETPDDRFLVYMEGAYAEDQGEETQNEVFGGAKLEVDLSERWFVYGRTRLERDEFENLNLRATATGGLGYFVFEEEHHELKLRGGAGFQSENFNDGAIENDLVLEAGYDYRYDFREWLRFTHSLTYFPTIEDPAGDYRVLAETAGEIPLSGSTGGDGWKVRAGMRNEYDAMPRPGIERLDTSYFLNFAHDWD